MGHPALLDEKSGVRAQQAEESVDVSKRKPVGKAR
jgi:hypothetical protein